MLVDAVRLVLEVRRGEAERELRERPEDSEGVIREPLKRFGSHPLDCPTLIRHPEDRGCEFVREGGNHAIYRNCANGRIRTVPRHREIKETTARAIREGLGIPLP